MSFAYPDGQKVLGKAAGYDSPNDCWTADEQREAFEEAWREAGESIFRDRTCYEAEAVRALEAKMEVQKAAENLDAVYQAVGVAARTLMEAFCKAKCSELGIALTAKFTALAELIQKVQRKGAFPGYIVYFSAVKEAGNALGHHADSKHAAPRPSLANCAVMCCKYTVEVLKQHERHKFGQKPDFTALKRDAQARHLQRVRDAEARRQRDQQAKAEALAQELVSKRLEVIEAENALLQQKAEDEERHAQLLAQRQAVLESEQQAQEARRLAAEAAAAEQETTARAAAAKAEEQEARRRATEAEQAKLQDVARADAAAAARLRAEAEAAQRKEAAAKAEAEAAIAKAKLEKETAALLEQQAAADASRALLVDREAAAAAAKAAEVAAVAALQEETRKRLEAEARAKEADAQRQLTAAELAAAEVTRNESEAALLRQKEISDRRKAKLLKQANREHEARMEAAKLEERAQEARRLADEAETARLQVQADAALAHGAAAARKKAQAAAARAREAAAKAEKAAAESRVKLAREEAERHKRQEAADRAAALLREKEAEAAAAKAAEAEKKALAKQEANKRLAAKKEILELEEAIMRREAELKAAEARRTEEEAARERAKADAARQEAALSESRTQELLARRALAQSQRRADEARARADFLEMQRVQAQADAARADEAAAARLRVEAEAERAACDAARAREAAEAAQARLAREQAELKRREAAATAAEVARLAATERAEKARAEAAEAEQRKLEAERACMELQAVQRRQARLERKLKLGGWYALFPARFKALVGLCALMQLLSTIANMHSTRAFLAHPGARGPRGGLLAVMLVAGFVWMMACASLVLSVLRKKERWRRWRWRSWRPSQKDDIETGGSAGLGGNSMRARIAAVAPQPAMGLTVVATTVAVPSVEVPTVVRPDGNAAAAGAGTGAAGGLPVSPSRPALAFPWWADKYSSYSVWDRACLSTLSLLVASPVLTGLVIPVAYGWDVLPGVKLGARLPRLLPGVCPLRLTVLLSYMQAPLVGFPSIICAGMVLRLPPCHAATANSGGFCLSSASPSPRVAAQFSLATGVLTCVFTVALWGMHMAQTYRLFDFSGQVQRRLSTSWTAARGWLLGLAFLLTFPLSLLVVLLRWEKDGMEDEEEDGAEGGGAARPGASEAATGVGGVGAAVVVGIVTRQAVR
ncbi:hypothetical protein PLESTB_001394200 [Pleodorina starrii]|uniref:Uncharacterized protein n=1 Tax=Pleodorina starrii TaxID=330485 RepID=A0A9W6BVB5_9CHLO|nr:hypothetical protein PLESTM_000538100 [Pleodorina starrii]GLC58728.1 hypothetical protein PLESTB_001394200 [Pleodorina starrii]GLC75186.1 hypothetical protein PLESTF_001604800 [Pleodorina starrii]